MKRDNFWLKSVKWLSGCVFFSVSLSTLPAQAATFSRATSNFVFSQFSDNAFSTGTFTNTDTFAFAGGGATMPPETNAIVATADAEAIFINDAAQAGNFVRTEAFVDTPLGIAIADGEASLVGTFNIGAGDSFSFNFLSIVDLIATVDNSSQGVATAESSVAFNILNITDSTPIILDIFELSAGISTGDNNDFLALNISEQNNFLINQQQSFAALDFDGDTREVQSQVVGSYRRFFADETLISVVESKQSSSFGSNGPNNQSIPEPTTSILIGGLISSGLLLKKKAK